MAVAEHADPGGHRNGSKPAGIERAADGCLNCRPDACIKGALYSGGVNDREQGAASVTGLDQGPEDRVTVARGPRTGGISCVDETDCAAGGLSEAAAHLLETDERYPHPFVVAPEVFSDLQGLTFGTLGLVIRDDEAVALQGRDIGEWVADEHASGEAAGAGFDGLGQADAFAEEPGGGNEFVTAHEGRDWDDSCDGMDFSRHDPQQQAGRSFAGLEEIHMRVGVVGHDGFAVPDHAFGQNAVQIERHDNWNPLAEDTAGLFKQVALGVEFLLAGHRPVHAEIDAVEGQGSFQCSNEIA